MTKALKPVTLILAISMIMLGSLGFVMDPVLGITVNTLQNLVHLTSGILALIAFRSGHSHMRSYMIACGLLYTVFAVFGFLGVRLIVQTLDVNTAGNYVHFLAASASLFAAINSDPV